METSFDERQSLELIHNMINKGKRNFKEGSIFYLLWGWAVLLAGMGQYLLLNFWHYENHWVSWPALIFGAAISSAIIGRKQGQKRKFVTFTDTAMKYLWIGFMIYLFVVLLISHQVGWAASYILTVGLYGLGTFVSGGILQFRPLIIGGLASLALAFMGIFMPSLFESFSNVLLLLCLSIVVSYLIPGYLLRAKSYSDAS